MRIIRRTAHASAGSVARASASRPDAAHLRDLEQITKRLTESRGG